MSWPGSTVPTTNLDAGTDSPASARADLKTAVDHLNTIIGARGSTTGIASLDSSGKVPFAQLPVTKFGNGLAVLTNPTTSWTVPADVYRIKVRAVGGGGGGGYTTPGTGGDHGGGGGAGAVVERWFDVTPGAVFTCSIGLGGAGKSAASDGDGADGGDTVFMSPGSGAVPASHEVRAKGGGGGEGPPNRFGGAGGEPIGGNLNLWGGAGVSGTTRGGVGGANAMTGGAAGAVGVGGGGGGGSGSLTPGFSGLDGVIVIEW